MTAATAPLPPPHIPFVSQEPITSGSIVSAATQYGVLSVTMDAHVLQFYTGGVITNGSVCAHSNHAVAIVGYGTTTSTNGNLSSGTGAEDSVDYFKVRNSYGEAFGEAGYFRISMEAAEACGIAGMHGCVIAGTGATATATASGFKFD